MRKEISLVNSTRKMNNTKSKKKFIEKYM